MLTQTTQYGTAYEFGFDDSQAPSIAGFVARSADLRHEPEVFSTATDGEGHVDSVVVTKSTNRKITGTFTGYITSGYDADAIATSFSFRGRFFIVNTVGEPRRKGEFVEATLEATSFAGVGA